MNRGALQAQKKLRPHGARSRLAKKLGWRLDRMSRIVNGKGSPPNPRERAALEDELGIGWRLWDEPADDGKDAA